jgi:hypothetical protein
MGLGSSHSYAKFNLAKMKLLRACAEDQDKFEKLFILSWVMFDSSIMVMQSGRHALELIVPYNEDQDGISLKQYFVDAFSRLWKCVLRNGSAPTKTGKRIKYLTMGNQEALKTIALDLL